MARIPEAQTIPRKVVQIAPDIASYNAGMAGTGIASVGRAIGEVEKAATQYQVDKAAADFLILKSEQDNAYDQDDDYATIEERYSGAVNEGLGSVASRITNPRVRAQFVERYRPVVAQGQERIAKVAWGKEADSELAEMQERVDALKNAAWKGGDQDMVEANATAVSMFQSAQDMGYIKDTDRVKLTKQFKTDLAIGRLEMMDPENRISALRQTWAQNLPENVKGKLMREAQEAQIETQAMGIVDRYMDAVDGGMSESEVLKKVRKLNPKLRKKVEERFVYNFNLREKMEVEQQSDYLDKYQSDVALGKIKDIEAIPEWEGMDARTRQTLINARNSFAEGTKIRTDPMVMDELLLLEVKGERGDKKAFMELRKKAQQAAAEGKLSTSDYSKFSKISLEGIIPPEVKSGLTDLQAIKARLPEKGQTEKRNIMYGYVGDWRQDYIEKYGKQPTDRDRDEAIDRALMEFDTSWWWGGGKTVMEMNAEERASYDKAIEYFEVKGIQPTEAQLRKAFEVIHGID